MRTHLPSPDSASAEKNSRAAAAMASKLGQRLPPPASTSITSISDDLLCDIFILLPSLPSLVRAALACRTFLHAVRSSPAFRRRFRALHPPQLLGFFTDTLSTFIHPFVPLRRGSNPDLAAAVRGADFFLTRLPEDSDSSAGWELGSLHGGYVVLANSTTNQVAAYNPLTQALHLFPQSPEELLFDTPPEFHIVFSDEDQRACRMVSVQHRIMPPNVQACVNVFSMATREWQVLPWVETLLLLPQPEDEAFMFGRGTQLSGFIYWKHTRQAYVLILNTTTLQLSSMVLPYFGVDFTIGQIKDGKLCMVGTSDDNNEKTEMLVVCAWRGDSGGVEKWMLEHSFPLSLFIDATNSSTEDDATVQVYAVIDGFVYLSTKYRNGTESLLSLCLETSEINKLFDDTFTSPDHPYIMAWPPSLVCNKENSEIKVNGDSISDVGPMGTK